MLFRSNIILTNFNFPFVWNILEQIINSKYKSFQNRAKYSKYHDQDLLIKIVAELIVITEQAVSAITIFKLATIYAYFPSES